MHGWLPSVLWGLGMFGAGQRGPLLFGAGGVEVGGGTAGGVFAPGDGAGKVVD